ncbi:MAG: IS91 family transposase, partial [Armatimonadetes bacterium]|nr:IS91 family transposase [Armatimonadota bacterium]
MKEPTQSRKACHSAWAKLISKVYQTDPLACPQCKNPMKIVAFIEEDEPVKAILKHFHLWDYPRGAPPKKIPLPQ